MNTQPQLQNLSRYLFPNLAAMLAFVVSLVICQHDFPALPCHYRGRQIATGFLASPSVSFNAFANALILVWAARRSSFKGLALIGQLFALSFGAQVFMTQIETAYFLSAFPLLHDNFQLYNLILRGLLTSLFFSLLVTLDSRWLFQEASPAGKFYGYPEQLVKHGAWLAACLHHPLYAGRLFCGLAGQGIAPVLRWPGGTEWLFRAVGLHCMVKPEFPVFQYFRGVLWMLCLVPLFMGFSGKRLELVILSGLALALLPTAQLAFANPLMPAAVSLGHFWEVYAISTGIFGALCAWFIPKSRAGGLFECA